MQVSINPKMLIWAREESEMTIEDVSSELEIEPSVYIKLESNGENIPFDILQKISKLYKRQISIFFLPEVPNKINKPKDYRNISVTKQHFSKDVILAIRRTSRYLQVAEEINGIGYWTEQYKWLEKFSGKEELVNEETFLLREILASPIEEQFKLHRSDTAFRYWRNKVEERLGVFVFQFPMPEKEIDGFSYSNNRFPYAIVINSVKQPVRKIFTIFHELAHIIKKYPGVCKTEISTEIDRGRDIEFVCNTFAGKFLVPLNHIRLASTVDEIYELASIFNISGEVYLRRLYEENKIAPKAFFDLLNEVKEKSQSLPRKKSGFATGVILSKSTRGNSFFHLVTNLVNTNQISYSAASDLLGLKISSIR
jgi:Zn-dependent peptidase ImmA (M78 family)